ncbi:MAG: replication protein [Armatimonadetes bacterium]|nr:replication protein [Armatimonadota bacterium]
MTTDNPTIRSQTPSSFPLGSTPFPNYLIDEEMPRLSDTEWRIVCVLARQTLGWKGEEGRRKARDWLTHSQLKERTGRESAAVCRAIQSLLDKRLIVVEDSDGKPLLTAQQRQFKMGRLYFRLHVRVFSF